MPSIEFISNRNVTNMIDKFEHKECGSGRVSACVLVSDAVSPSPPTKLDDIRWGYSGKSTHDRSLHIFGGGGDSWQSQIQSPEQFSFGGGWGGCSLLTKNRENLGY